MHRRVIFLDADCFYASVEQSANPKLRGKPVAVGGERRGIIASASYEARRFGVYTPMPTVQARKLCPKLIIIPGDFEKYEQFSTLMFSYCYDFTPDVEQMSIDEGYCDITASRKPPPDIAGMLRRAIQQSLKINVSAGLGRNKLISQIACKLHKPTAFSEIPIPQELLFLHPLPNSWMPGVGPKTASQLNAAGLALVRHLAFTPLELIELLLGKVGRSLQQFANGIDDRPILPVRAPAKSFSHQETFAQDITDEEYIQAVLHHMADKLFATIRAESKSIRCLTVKVRYNDMEEDQCSETLVEPTDLETDIYGRLPLMLRRAWKRRVSLRLVSLKLSNVYDSLFPVELPLETSAQRQAARQRLAIATDELRRLHGTQVLLRGHDFQLRLGPCSGSPTAPPLESSSPLLHSQQRLVEKPLASNSQADVLSSRSNNGETRTLYGSARWSVRIPSGARIRYVPLGFHSCYSFLDSTLSISAIIRLAKQHQLSAVALIDRGNLHGAAEFVTQAKEAGIKPIVGAEILIGHSPLFLFVESARGYHNLCQLLSRKSTFLPGPERHDESVADQQRRPFSSTDLRDFTDGLIAVSADTSFADLFPRRFYQRMTSSKSACSGKGVVCPSIHYATPADRAKFDIVQSIRTRTLLQQTHPEKHFNSRLHFRAPEELAETCGNHLEWLEHSREIADRCAFEFPFGKPQFPVFSPPAGFSSASFLRKLVLEGLRARYGLKAPQIQPQVEEELSIIHEVGYEDYFLAVWEILQLCREQGIEWITRGSAADSLVCYCLKISNVCPIRFDLYFRRFLNKDRMQLNKLPDVDIDFAHDRKDDVVDLIFKKYGPEKTAVVGGFSTFQARSAFAEIAKVLGVSEHQVRRFTENFPWTGAREIAEQLRESIECRDLPLNEEPYQTALQVAAFLDGFPRYPKMHPCGVVISLQPMHELTPTFTSNKGYPTTHFDMDAVETIGLVKMDILAQGGLAAIRDTRSALALEGKSFDLEALEPWEDPSVWEMISSGNARGVHHIESPAMINLCKMCNVREIDGLVAIVSVIRPGAANENKKRSFTRRYQRLEPIGYPHPSLEPCLKSTFGLIVYEEHILQICELFAGLSPGRADVLRRALGKGGQAVIDTIEKEFFAAAAGRGHPSETIREVWNLVKGFSGYAFCKAHSTAYAVEAFQSAWLKKNHPVHFMAAVLTNGKGFYHPLVYVLECHRIGIRLISPWVNDPGPHFTVCDQAIRVPVTRIKGLTDRTRDKILEERSKGCFQSLTDFYLRVTPQTAEMEALIRAGAFDGFHLPRTIQFWEHRFLEQTFGTKNEPRQGWLFAAGPETYIAEILRKSELCSSRPQQVQPALATADQGLLSSLAPVAPLQLQEPDMRQKLQWEVELIGFPVSQHPLALYDKIAWDTYCPVSRLYEHIGEEVVMCGLVIEQRLHHESTGEPMKFLTLCDWTGMVETELFAATYRSYGLNTVRYPVLEINAIVEPFENGRGYSLRVLRAGKPRQGS